MDSLATQRPGEDVSTFVEELQAAGTYTFSFEDVQAMRSASEVATMAALRRLKRRGRIVVPRRGFYVIVPTEYRAAGSPPPSWFVDDLMSFLGQPYYVGLLSAAALHGASHQQPMAFQVITDRPTRDGVAGRARIEFHMSGSVGDTPAARVRTETGTMLVSSPEATAFDLVRFPGAAGGWSGIAMVLQELSERLAPDALQAAAASHKTPDIQRLGYVLDQVGQPRLAEPLLRVLASRRYRPVALASDASVTGKVAESPWRVIPNVDVELDL
ncbi:MAG: type IV toxin-antitoxin system AbiEi family antitoxin [Actinomycetota bacterium]|nr:type IV toxin-antitoxin system AbiEi family antitoxin [Actinomycetota bacterium]